MLGNFQYSVVSNSIKVTLVSQLFLYFTNSGSGWANSFSLMAVVETITHRACLHLLFSTGHLFR